MEDLIKLVEEWSKNKGLDKSEPNKQALMIYSSKKKMYFNNYIFKKMEEFKI